MKKTILLFSTALFTVATFAQQVIYNGEDVNPGWWCAAPFERGLDNDWDNPQKTGINTSDKCVSIWINNDEVDWTSGGLGGLNIDIATSNRISVMVYKLVAGPVRIELQDGINPNFTSIQDYTTTGEWQTLVFEIPANLGNITTLLLAPHFENHETNPIPDGEAHRFFWDNVVAYKENTNPTSVVFFDKKNKEIISTQVYTIAGALVESFEKENVDLSKFPKGIYVLKQTDVDGNVTSKKITN